jgi:tetratricopeptide (TPR) repeat protein
MARRDLTNAEIEQMGEENPGSAAEYLRLRREELEAERQVEREKEDEDWEEAYAHVLSALEGRTPFDVLQGLYLQHEVEALLRGGDERLAREEMRRFAQRAEINERDRIAYLRSLALLSEFEGNTQRAIEHLHEAEALAEKIGLPGELRRIRSRLGDLHERRGEDGLARQAFSRAVQTLRMLAEKIGDDKLRNDFLAAPQVHRVLGRA